MSQRKSVERFQRSANKMDESESWLNYAAASQHLHYYFVCWCSDSVLAAASNSMDSAANERARERKKETEVKPSEVKLKSTPPKGR